jgi:hypothetical protein
MKKIMFLVFVMFLGAAFGFGVYPVPYGFVAKNPKLDIPGGKTYCRFVPDSALPSEPTREVK